MPEPITAEQLARYLFGDPLDPNDLGLVGRLSQQLQANTSRVDRLMSLGWAVMLVTLTGVLALVADLVLRVISLSQGHP